MGSWSKPLTKHVIVLTEDGHIQINGSSNLVQAMNDNQELYQYGVIAPALLLNYPLLPSSPFSHKLKGSAMIRTVLTKMLTKRLLNFFEIRDTLVWGSLQ